MQKKQKIIVAVSSLFCSALIFFSALLVLKGEKIFSITGEGEKITKNQNLKRSPFSGIPCSSSSRRAFSVVLALYPETNPLSGVSGADIVIEGPVATPMGITRLLAIYQCQSPPEIGSIRSVRPYMVDLALGFDTIFASWGGCNLAIQRIKNFGLDWFDARVLISSGTFFRKRNIPAPHNGFTSMERLMTTVKNLKVRETNQFEGYQFLKEEEITLNKEGQEIKINYTYPVKYIYDPATGDYLRFWNGKPMEDRNTSKQVRVKNVILMKTEMANLSPGVIDIQTTGVGEVLVYQGGKKIRGVWQKENPGAKLSFFDKEGNEIKFIPGPIWIELVSKF